SRATSCRRSPARRPAGSATRAGHPTGTTAAAASGWRSRSARRRRGLLDDHAPQDDRLEGSIVGDVVLSAGRDRLDRLEDVVTLRHLAEDRQVAVVLLVRRQRDDEL